MRMHKKPWVFSAVTILLLANVLLGKQTIIGMTLLVFWIARIILLGDKSVIWRIIWIGLFFIVTVGMHQHKNKSTLLGEEELFVVSPELSSIQIDGDYLSFRGWIQNTKEQTQNERIIIRHYIKTEEEKNEWENTLVPKYLKIEGVLNKPAPNSNFNQFNYQDYLKRNNIHWQLQAETIEMLKDIKLTESVRYKIDVIRYRIIQYINQTFHEKVSSYLKILFLADGSALNEQTKDSYRALGLIHLFSISGFHISYLAKVFERFFLRIGITHERTRILLIMILPLYGLLAGLSISVFRAICQRTFLLWSTSVDKELDSLDAWSLAMIASLIINPYHLFELAFQLSYSLSGLFIIVGQQKWIQELNFLKQTVLLSLLSFLVSLPLLSYHFYEISWITVFANLVFMPFFIFVLFPSLAFLFLTSFFFSNTTIFLILNKLFGISLIEIENHLFNLTGSFDFSFIIGRLPQIVLIILILCILNVLKKIEQKQKPSLSIVLLMVGLIYWYQLSPAGYVLMLDVGQGDSILIKEPGSGKVTLIDTGGELQWQEREPWQEREKKFRIGQDIVAPSLKSLGISSIDRLYITHAHEDHMGEIGNIHKETPIKEIATARCTFQGETLIRKLKTLEKSQLLEVSPLTKLDYPTAQTLALHPIKDYQSKNDKSLVLYVKIGEDYWLFTGDMEEAAEKDLIQNYPSLPVDYLKVAHHGSKTSSTEELLNHIKPKVALISAGEKNRYGHPDIEVLELFENKKIKVYSTVENGAIKVSYFKIPLMNKWITKNERIH